MAEREILLRETYTHYYMSLVQGWPDGGERNITERNIHTTTCLWSRDGLMVEREILLRETYTHYYTHYFMSLVQGWPDGGERNITERNIHTLLHVSGPGMA